MRAATALAAACLAALTAAGAAAVRAPRHVVLVIEENHSYSQIIGSRDCPYLNALARGGLLLTDSRAITHPSLPNYLALFAGGLFGSPPDTCPPAGSPFPGPDLDSALRAVGRSFKGYSEGLPSAGSRECADSHPNGYRRKHNPWSDFSDVPASDNLPLRDFPKRYDALPTVAFVVPDLEHDMHNGSPAQGDRWLRRRISGYARWCRSHGSVLIVTFDEDNGAEGNRIPTLVYGAGVRPGRTPAPINHYGLLRTLCLWYGAAAPGRAARARPLEGLFGL